MPSFVTALLVERNALAHPDDAVRPCPPPFLSGASFRGIHAPLDGDDPAPAQGHRDTTQLHGMNGEDGVKAVRERDGGAHQINSKESR